MKRITSDPFVIVTAAVLAFIFLYQFQTLFEESPKATLNEISVDYNEGLKAKAQNIRQSKFNAALESLLSLENKYQPTMGNGKLYHNIGMTFFQLNEMPMAILYLNRSLALRPRDDNVAQHLAMAEKKALLEENQPQPEPFKRLFWFYNNFSLPERLELFFYFSLLAIVTISLSVWRPNALANYLSVLFSVLAIVYMCTLMWDYTFSPTEGILTASTPFHKGPGKEFAKLSDEPEKAGKKVLILDTTFSGQWIKVQASKDKIGYIPGSAIQKI